MTLMELINYFEKGSPIRITNKDEDFYIDCYSEHFKDVLKQMENDLQIENFYRIISDTFITSIYYDDTNAEAIGIILEEKSIFSKLKKIMVWYDFSNKIYNIYRYSNSFKKFLSYELYRVDCDLDVLVGGESDDL